MRFQLFRPTVCRIFGAVINLGSCSSDLGVFLVRYSTGTNKVQQSQSERSDQKVGQAVRVRECVFDSRVSRQADGHIKGSAAQLQSHSEHAHTYALQHSDTFLAVL